MKIIEVYEYKKTYDDNVIQTEILRYTITNKSSLYKNKLTGALSMILE